MNLRPTMPITMISCKPISDLPDLRRLKMEKKVTTPEIWWKQRRPEIVEDMEKRSLWASSEKAFLLLNGL